LRIVKTREIPSDSVLEPLNPSIDSGQALEPLNGWANPAAIACAHGFCALVINAIFPFSLIKRVSSKPLIAGLCYKVNLFH
jgi:hypothetical protein